ncbi:MULTISPECIES: hypothetical protein [Halolamina]|uniref:Uncharacterized protein n=1 Tax=Halolamina pelagica TaxID=699431 RepID=A0A1I5SK76_9EURY|nr:MULTISPECIES: hypothetical protein [Halolamina]NHX37030.1 hypothetical protein [Halolamina sp. R1-12]SFP70917.1 hypothetical protein SAMN05216277_106148 [Halolamina pelagica]
MALFDDEDESDDTTESDAWGVDEDRRSSSDPDGAGGPGDADPLADLETATVAADDPNGTLKRAVDPEAGVVIYAYKNGNAGGLSTVPLAETDLATEDGT